MLTREDWNTLDEEAREDLTRILAEEGRRPVFEEVAKRSHGNSAGR